LSDRLTQALPRDPSAPRQARRLVEGHAAALPAERLDAAVLLVSELVTNALVHGEGEILLELDMDGDGLHVEIGDHGRRAPHIREDPGADGGWGLRLVEAMARRWGVRDGATRVWFDV
jgi:anti-sigma regulatory factor (Ser/Thr protein kinase)